MSIDIQQRIRWATRAAELASQTVGLTISGDLGKKVKDELSADAIGHYAALSARIPQLEIDANDALSGMRTREIYVEAAASAIAVAKAAAQELKLNDELTLAAQQTAVGEFAAWAAGESWCEPGAQSVGQAAMVAREGVIKGNLNKFAIDMGLSIDDVILGAEKIAISRAASNSIATGKATQWGQRIRSERSIASLAEGSRTPGGLP